MGGKAKAGNTTGRVVGQMPSAPVPADKANPPLEGSGRDWVDNVQTGLDVLGLVPVVGEVADGVNGLISLARGDYAGAALSFAAMIPFAGWGATAAKAGRKVVQKATQQTTKHVAQEAAQQTAKKTAGKSKPPTKSKDTSIKGDCKTGSYKKLKCPPGNQKHHIVPDFVVRMGKRKDKKSRIPGMPSLDAGPSICLSGGSKKVKGTAHDKDATHSQAHAHTDGRIADAGKRPGGPEGVAPIGEVALIAMLAMAEVRPECYSEIMTMVKAAFQDVDPHQLVRTTKSLPTAEARKALGKGTKTFVWS